jgi:hypothetical protein
MITTLLMIFHGEVSELTWAHYDLRIEVLPGWDALILPPEVVVAPLPTRAVDVLQGFILAGGRV